MKKSIFIGNNYLFFFEMEFVNMLKPRCQAIIFFKPLDSDFELEDSDKYFSACTNPVNSGDFCKDHLHCHTIDLFENDYYGTVKSKVTGLLNQITNTTARKKYLFEVLFSFMVKVAHNIYKNGHIKFYCNVLIKIMFFTISHYNFSFCKDFILDTFETYHTLESNNLLRAIINLKYIGTDQLYFGYLLEEYGEDFNILDVFINHDISYLNTNLNRFVWVEYHSFHFIKPSDEEPIKGFNIKRIDGYNIYYLSKEGFHRKVEDDFLTYHRKFRTKRVKE